MKCQRLFSEKNKKNISLSFAEFAQRALKAKHLQEIVLGSIDNHGSPSVLT